MFKVGDRVQCVHAEYVTNNGISGHEGIVRVADKDGSGFIGVEWDHFNNGHSIDGFASSPNSGWWVPVRSVALVDEGQDEEVLIDEGAFIETLSTI